MQMGHLTLGVMVYQLIMDPFWNILVALDLYKTLNV